MNKQIDFSIVFPVMNQADHIEEIIRAYHKTLSQSHFSFELIAVVNGSSDRSFAICSRLTKKFNNIRAFELSGRGFGLGILYGLKQGRGRYFCYLNCARIKPSDLLLSLQYFHVNPEFMVHGVRKARDRHRHIGSKIYNGVCQLMFHLSTSDLNGNPNVFSREHYEKLDLSFTDSMIDLEFSENAKKKGIHIVEVPILSYKRHGGKSTTSFHTIFRLAKEMTRYWLRTRLGQF